jgi:pimeloyl-ACP methyl ester carboxylesterase
MPTAPAPALPGFLRTPDERFAKLPGYDVKGAFKPHYVSNLPGYEGIRVHYLDLPAPTGLNDAPVFLCLHGNPSWTYLYRKMVPLFATAGRVVAPDLIGFGRSDKAADEAWHGFERHRHMLLAFIRALDLRRITLVVQDWGGLFGLTLPMEPPDMPGRFERLVVMNTGLATGSLPSEGFAQWRAFSNSQPDLAIGKMFKRGKPDMTLEEAAAYDAPFPDATYKAAIRRFPNLVPEHRDGEGAEISRRAAKWWASEWQGQSFMAVGVQDPVLGPPQMAALRQLIRGCPEPLLIPEGGHFVQEWGEPIARAALARFAKAA